MNYTNIETAHILSNICFELYFPVLEEDMNHLGETIDKAISVGKKYGNIAVIREPASIGAFERIRFMFRPDKNDLFYPLSAHRTDEVSCTLFINVDCYDSCYSFIDHWIIQLDAFCRAIEFRFGPSEIRPPQIPDIAKLFPPEYTRNMLRASYFNLWKTQEEPNPYD